MNKYLFNHIMIKKIEIKTSRTLHQNIYIIMSFPNQLLYCWTIKQFCEVNDIRLPIEVILFIISFTLGIKIKGGHYCLTVVRNGKIEILGNTHWPDFFFKIKNTENIKSFALSSESICIVTKDNDIMIVRFKNSKWELFCHEKSEIAIHKIKTGPSFNIILTECRKIILCKTSTIITDDDQIKHVIDFQLFILNLKIKKIAIEKNIIFLTTTGQIYYLSIMSIGKFDSDPNKNLNLLKEVPIKDIIKIKSNSTFFYLLNKFGDVFIMPTNTYSKNYPPAKINISKIMNIYPSDTTIVYLTKNRKIFVQQVNSTLDSCVFLLNDEVTFKYMEIMLENVVYVYNADSYFLALDSTNKVYYWGDSSSCQSATGMTLVDNKKYLYQPKFLCQI